jgi:glycosyltransferase involved in cell wall biosynthesis
MRWLYRGLFGAMPMGRMGVAYFKNYGIPDSKMNFVPHEPDYSKFTAVDSGSLDAFMDRYKLVPGRQQILCCNRLVPVKRVDLIIKAFIKISKIFHNVDLLIVGSGPLEEELVNLVPADLSDRVRWLGQLQIDEVVCAYHASDLFVLASDYEPWATVISEAAATSLPIVASNVVGAAYEVFEDGVGGMLFESGDVASLTQSMICVLEDLEGFKRGVVAGLQQWRASADPVDGIARALQRAGVLDVSISTSASTNG